MHQNRGQVPTWANDAVPASGPDGGRTKSQAKKKPASDDYLNFDSDDSKDEDEDDVQDTDDDEDEGWQW